MHYRPLLLIFLGTLTIGEAKHPCKSGTLTPSPTDQPPLESPAPSAAQSPAQSAAQSVAQSAAQSATSSAAQSTATSTGNWGFDDGVLAPWDLWDKPNPLANWEPPKPGSVDIVPNKAADLAQGGPFSAKFTFRGEIGRAATQYVVRPLDMTRIKAGVPIQISAMFTTTTPNRLNSCTNYFMACSVGDERDFGRASRNFVQEYRYSVAAGPVTDVWANKQGTCRFTQDQIKRGNLLVRFGWNCLSGGQAWIDTTSVVYQ